MESIHLFYGTHRNSFLKKKNVKDTYPENKQLSERRPSYYVHILKTSGVNL